MGKGCPVSGVMGSQFEGFCGGNMFEVFFFAEITLTNIELSGLSFFSEFIH